MIYDKTGKYGPEWARDVILRSMSPKGFRKPSQLELAHAQDILEYEAYQKQQAKSTPGLLARLFKRKREE